MAAGEDVGHFVGQALNVGDFVIVSVVPVMEAGEAAKVGSRMVQCDGALLILGNGSSVVI